MRLHAGARQKISGWTDFNIWVRNEVEGRGDSVGYLPTINAPATNMSFRNIQSEHKVWQWRKFLLNPKNKKAFTEFVVKKWRRDTHGTKLTGKVLFATCESDCCEITSEATKTTEELNSTHEEADTRLILHAAHAARSGYKAVVVVSKDTDVFLLCLAFKCFIPASMYVNCGTQTRTKYVSITSVVGAVGGELCKFLTGMYAFTDCDTVSVFAWRGKITALRLVEQQKSYEEMYKQLRMGWVLSNELFQSLQEFTCKLYDSQPGTDNINELRFRIFCAKRGNIDSTQLPPRADCLFKHASRANFQAAIWNRSLQRCPLTPTRIGSGWREDGDNFAIDWMSGDPASTAVLELLSFSCTWSCNFLPAVA